MAPHPDPTIAWPTALRLPPGSAGLSWGMTLADTAARVDGVRHLAPPITRLVLDAPAIVQGLALTATLVFELERLVRIELAGAIDGLVLAALGAEAAGTFDVGHYRLRRGDTVIEIDALDGLVALEPAPGSEPTELP